MYEFTLYSVTFKGRETFIATIEPIDFLYSKNE